MPVATHASVQAWRTCNNRSNACNASYSSSCRRWSCSRSVSALVPSLVRCADGPRNSAFAMNGCWQVIPMLNVSMHPRKSSPTIDQARADPIATRQILDAIPGSGDCATIAARNSVCCARRRSLAISIRGIRAATVAANVAEFISITHPPRLYPSLFVKQGRDAGRLLLKWLLDLNAALRVKGEGAAGRDERISVP